MDNQKYVIESFSRYLKYKGMELNEKKGPGTPLDLSGAETLVKLIMKDNVLLAEALYAKTKGSRGEYLREASKKLKEEKYALGGLYSIAGVIMSRDLSETDFKILQVLDPSVKDEDFKNLSGFKNRRAKGQSLMKTLSELSDDEALKRAREVMKVIPKGGNYIPSGIKTPFIWGALLSEEEKDQTYSSFLTEAQKKGYDSLEGLKRVIDKEFKSQRKDDRPRMTLPGIEAFIDKTESAQPQENKIPPKVFKTAIIQEEKQSEVFKQNMYGANGEDDYMEGTFKEMLDNLGAIFQRILTGEIASIQSITVYTSADRYRNTGSAEKLSWGQLSYLRSVSMASVVVDMARKSGLPEEIVTMINEMIKLNFKGDNGDGTSGPNAPDPIKFGYYVEENGKAVWKDGKDRNFIQVVATDEDGTPQGDPKDVKKSPENSKDDYNKYRYNNIEIEYVASEKGGTKEPPDDTIEKVVDLKYPIKIKIPSRYRGRVIKIPIPGIELGLKVAAAKGGTRACPDFGSAGGAGVKVRTTFGFTIKTVTIARWKSDLTK